MKVSAFLLAVILVGLVWMAVTRPPARESVDGSLRAGEEFDAPARLELEREVDDAPAVEETAPASPGVAASAQVRARALAAGVNEILASELAEIHEEWLPSRSSLEYWLLEHRVGQIRDLTVERVRSYRDFEERWPEYALLLEGREGLLRDWIDLPGPDDVERLWNLPGVPGHYEETLYFEHASFIAGEAGCRLELDAALRSELQDLEDAWYARALELWITLGDPDDVYPHWGFLVWVSERHFE